MTTRAAVCGCVMLAMCGVMRTRGCRRLLVHSPSGRADGFAEAAYIEGKPQASRYVKSLAEAVDYIVRNA